MNSQLSEIGVPFNRPYLAGGERAYLEQVLADGQTSGDGPFGKACEKLLEQELPGMRALLTSSCTHALELGALIVLREGTGEVILPSYTFATTASAFSRFGARLAFADIEEETLCIDPRSVEQLITPETRALVPVHYGGWGCRPGPLLELARQAGVALFEDNAQGLFGSVEGQRLGTLGMSATSFHATKNFSCGEGGALFVRDPEAFDLAVVLREKGTNRRQFLEGRVDKYTWLEQGSSYLMSELQAAFLLAQLEGRQPILERRRHICQEYLQGLGDWAGRYGVRLVCRPETTGHIFAMLMPTNASRRGLFEHLRERGVQAASHYLPLHLSPMGLEHGRHRGCPVTERVADTLLRLPVSASLTSGQVDRVLSAVLDFRP